MAIGAIGTVDAIEALRGAIVSPNVWNRTGLEKVPPIPPSIEAPSLKYAIAFGL